MQARVKQDARYSNILALSGIEFTKSEWRNVPVGFEAEAIHNEYLEVRETVIERKQVIASNKVAHIIEDKEGWINTEDLIAVEDEPKINPVKPAARSNHKHK